ncbi:LTA synthase family protein [Falsibacillus albus]|uniref:LTA synthase family protein n=1 Tax=Falsibacillus albus TaxID=2478915 RepID=A0A3L7K0X1_9BACI|nr:LTA synthase family protein [Falsibacillus albus]RLQ96235.1 LTA synthase family protein [Falsibacillus albus]
MKSKFFKSHFAVYSILLIVKAIVVHAILFQDYKIFKIVTVEGSFILLFMGFIEWISRKGKPYAYLFGNILISTLFAAIMLYVTWFNTIPTYHVLLEISQLGAIRDSVTSLLSPLYILLYADILILAISLVLKKYPLDLQEKTHSWTVRSVFISLAVFVLVFSYFKNINIANPVLAAEAKGIFNYEAINIYKAPQKNDLLSKKEEKDPYAINKKIASLKGNQLIPQKDRKYNGLGKGRNVIVIQGESFQNFLIGLKVNGKEVTPNLNKLVKHSFYFSNVFQQVGPGNTSDAELIMNTSLFPDSNTPTSLTVGNKDIPSLPKVLNQNGYRTMTFHTDKVNFWNRDQLYPDLGFDKYYDESYFGDEDQVGMASSDDVLYQKGADILKKSKEPFYSMFISLSSHHPFVIPDTKQTIDLPPEYDGTLIGDYLKAQSYTDASIGRFIDRLKQEGLWDNSVILFYGDHLGLQDKALGGQDQELLEKLLGHKYSLEDRYKIPFIMTIPGKTDQGKQITRVGGQLDFMPTLANVLGVNIDHKLVHFGQDMLQPFNTLTGIRYYLPTGGFVNNNIIYYPNEGFEDGDAFDLKSMERIKDFSSYKSDYEHVLELERMSDSYFSQLPESKKN